MNQIGVDGLWTDDKKTCLVHLEWEGMVASLNNGIGIKAKMTVIKGTLVFNSLIPLLPFYPGILMIVPYRWEPDGMMFGTVVEKVCVDAYERGVYWGQEWYENEANDNRRG